MKRPFLYDSVYIWLYYPSFIKWKMTQRALLDSDEQDHLITTINQSIIIDLATFIEGIVHEMQSEILFMKFNTDNAFEKNLSNYFDNKLSNCTWANYVEYFDMLLGKKLSSSISDKNWKCISTLFNFRNSLVHGKAIDIDYYEEDSIISAEASKRFKNVFQYLKEQKIVDLSFAPYINTVNLVSDEVISHFYDETIHFLEELFILFPELNELKVNFEDSLKM